MKKLIMCLCFLPMFNSVVFAKVETYQVYDKDVRKDTSWYVENGIVYKAGTPIKLTVKNENYYSCFSYDESFMGDIYNKGFNTVRVVVPKGFPHEKLIDFIDLATEEYDINVILATSSDYNKDDIRSLSEFTRPFPNVVGIETDSELVEAVLNANLEILVILKKPASNRQKIPAEKTLIIQPIMELIHKKH